MDHYDLSKRGIFILKALAVVFTLFLVNIIVRSMMSLGWKLILFLIALNFLVALFYGKKVIFLLLVELPILSQIPRDAHNYSSSSVEIALFTVLLFFLVKFIFKKDIKIKKTRIDMPLLGLVFISALSLFLTTNSRMDLELIGCLHILANFQNIFLVDQLHEIYPFRAFWTILEGACFFFLCSNVYDKRFFEENNKLSISSLSIAVVVLFFFGIIQHVYTDSSVTYRGITRINSLLPDANTLGIWLISFIPLLFFLSVRNIGLWKKIALAGATLALILLASTVSRGAWLGFIVSTIFMTFLFNFDKFEKINKKKNWIIFGVLLAAVIGLILIFNYNSTFKSEIQENKYLNKVALPFDFNKTLQQRSTGRWYIWLAGMKAFTSNPIFGIGIGTFFKDMHNYYPSDIRPWGTYQDAHNYFFEIAAESGIFGLISILWIFWALLFYGVKKYIKDKDHILLGCIGGVVAIFIHSLVDHHLLIPEIFAGFWFLASIIIVYDQ